MDNWQIVFRQSWLRRCSATAGNALAKSTLFAALLVVTVSCVFAQETFPPKRPDAPLNGIGPAASPSEYPDQLDVVFRLAVDMLNEATVQLANGVVVNRSDWPTLIFAEVPKPEVDRVPKCTGTLIGPNVALTAAHCVDTLSGRPRRAWVTVDARAIELKCAMHKHYIKRDYAVSIPRGSEDFALCLLEDGGKPPPSLAALRFEVVDAVAALQASEPVLMTGYGCSDLIVTKSGALDWSEKSGVLRIGDALIASTLPEAPLESSYVTIVSSRGLEPALCPGDSGGPLLSGATSGTPDVGRRVRGVNSKIESRRRSDGDYDIVSSIAAIGTPLFRDWANEWIRDWNRQSKTPIICGLNSDAGHWPCRE